MRAILTYHSIDRSNSVISVSPETFERHVRWLTSGRVAVTSIEDLLKLPAATDAVAVTFDDGFVNFREIAAPRLLGAGLPVTLFVVGGFVGTSNSWNGHPDRGVPLLPLLDWPALARLREQGVVLGSHSLRHTDLTHLGRAAVEVETCRSMDIIEQETGVRPTIFAYPYGRRSNMVVEIVARQFDLACTTQFEMITDRTERARLPRLDMYYFRQVGRLETWGSGELSRYLKVRRRLRQL